jgi:hypothetical protein
LAGSALLSAWAWAQTPRWGDLNRNGRVDSDDAFDFAYFYGLQRGDRMYETEGFEADFDQNGKVDEIDLFEFTSRWHRE